MVSRRQFLVMVGGAAASALLAGCATQQPAKPTPTATPAGTATPAPTKKFVIPALFDLSGPTSGVGVPYSEGAKNCARWINEKEGGIPGVGQIDLVGTDYGYKVPEAVSVYNRYKSQYNPAVIVGWGTGDTEALSKEVAKDKIVYISASYSSHLDDPSKTPYNFYPVASYSDQARAAVYWMKEWWEKEGESRSPRLVCAYDFNSAYARAPIKAVKELAKELGFEIGDDQNVGLRATDTSSQVLAIKNFGADFVWFGNTVGSGAVIAKDMKKFDVRAILVMNQWGHDENLIKLAGEGAENVHGATGHYYWGFESEAPGLKTLRKSIEEYGPEEFPASAFIRGWLNVRTAALALADAKAKYGEITGENVKKAMESWKDKKIEDDISPPVTYTSTDHRPTTKALILKIENGKYKMASDGWVEIERKPEWLGW